MSVRDWQGRAGQSDVRHFPPCSIFPALPRATSMTMTERSLAFVYTPAIEPLAYPLDCPFKTQRAPLTR